MTRAIRVYADTSVYGGILDDEFKEPSIAFFEQVRGGRLALVVSALVQDELEGAPTDVQELFQVLRRTSEVIDLTEEVVRLQAAYLGAKVVGARWEADALHVALATIAECRLIVSWNFRHIVHYEKIPRYNGINLANGYASIAIHSPQEVIAHEDEDI